MSHSEIFKYYTSVYQEAPFAVFITDANFQVTWSNKAAEEQFSVLKLPGGLFSVLTCENSYELYSKITVNRRPVVLPTRSVAGDTCFFCIPCFKRDQLIGACFQLFSKQWAETRNINEIIASSNEKGVAKLSIWSTELLNHNFTLLRELSACVTSLQNDRAKQLADKLYQNNLKNLRFVRNLTLYSKFTSGIQDFAPARLDIIRFSEHLADNLKDFFMNSRIDFVFSCPDESLCVMADEDKLLVALLSLISNACKSIREQGKVELSLKNKEGNIIIKVADNGISLPTVDRNNIFRPWSTGVEYDLDDGLGLTLVQYIVNEHGGSVIYESGSEGTTFVVSLPVDPSTPPVLCNRPDYVIDRFSPINIQLCDAL